MGLWKFSVFKKLKGSERHKYYYSSSFTEGTVNL